MHNFGADFEIAFIVGVVHAAEQVGGGVVISKLPDIA